MIVIIWSMIRLFPVWHRLVAGGKAY